MASHLTAWSGQRYDFVADRAAVLLMWAAQINIYILSTGHSGRPWRKRESALSAKASAKHFHNMCRLA